MACDTSPYTISINEKSTGLYTATLKDENDDPIAAADVSTLTLTVIDEESGTVIRNAENALSMLDATSGELEWNIAVTDTTIVGSAGVGETEQHLATFAVTWTGGRRMNHEVRLSVKNLRSVS